MNRLFLLSFLCCFTLWGSLSSLEEHDPTLCTFDVPSGWQQVTTEALPDYVRVMFRGRGKRELPPTLSLATEETTLDLKEYVLSAKELFRGNPYLSVRDLGMVRTQSGPAALLVLEQESEWGTAKMLQAIFVKDTTAYALTATSLKKEFPQFQGEFFRAIKSFELHHDVFHALADTEKRTEVQMLCKTLLKEQWPPYLEQEQKKHPDYSPQQQLQAAFDNEQFQGEVWHAFQEALHAKTEEMSSEWHEQVLEKVRHDLLTPQRLS